MGEPVQGAWVEPPSRPTFSLPSDNQIRLALVSLVGLGVAIWLGTRAGQGNVRFVGGLVLTALLVVVVMKLGARSWLLLPLGMTLNVPVPLTFGREFNCRELSCIVLVIHTMCRVALRRQKLEIFRKAHVWPLLYAGWAFMVFLKNPTGLMSLGAETVGARFYFQIFLGLCSFLVVANTAVEERDMKWFFILTFAGACVNVAHGVWYWQSGQALVDRFSQTVNLYQADEEFYTWHQALSMPALVAVMLIFARYQHQEIASIRRAYLWLVIATAVGLIAFSGKRAGVGSVFLIPVFAALLHRRVGMGGILVLAMGVLIGVVTMSHGRILRLPLSAQRALSFLPGDWDPRVKMLGTQDEFRKLMREAALEQVQQHPWVGKGLAINLKEYWGDRLATGGQITAVTAGHSWHTLWLGIAADFGIPAAIIWALLWIHFTRLAFTLAPRLPPASWARTLASYLFIYLCWQWVNSYTSGHSAQPAFDGWWLYALLVPLSRMLERREEESAHRPAGVGERGSLPFPMAAR
jgi:hypothetical protein